MLVQKDLIISKLRHLTIRQRGEIIYDSQKERGVWETKPVHIETFITDREFLGNVFIRTDGQPVLYDFWYKLLVFLYASPFSRKYFEIILQAPTGSGKSYASVISILYEAYKIICMKNPQELYNLGMGTQILFMFFSLDLGSANVNWGFARKWIETSPFFKQFIKKMTNTKDMPSNSFRLHKEKEIYLNLGSNTDHQISRAIHSWIFDEADFHKGHIESPKEKYDSGISRIGSRFESFPGKSWLVTSATTEDSFSEIAKKEAVNKKTSFVVPSRYQWQIKGRDKYKEGDFYVFVGDANRDAFIITPETQKNVTSDMLIEAVPINFLDSFQTNLKKELKNIMNIKTSGSGRFFTNKNKLSKCMTNINVLLKSGEPRDIVEIDFDMQVDTLIQHFENLDYFKNPMYPFCNRNIHIDLGRKHDHLGIACSFATYKDEVYYQTDGKLNTRPERLYYVEWVLAIKAKKGQEIPYQKVIDLFVYLRSLKYNLIKVTTDQMEGGAKFRQDLNHAGILAEYLSTDRTKKPYEVYHSLVENALVILPDSPALFQESVELLDLEDKIDHPKTFADGTEGRKDIADAVAGTLYNSSIAPIIYNPVLLNNLQTENSLMKSAGKNAIKEFSQKFNTNFYNRF